MEHKALDKIAVQDAATPKSRKGSRYLVSVLGSLVLAALLFCALEFHIRSNGGIPSLDYSPERWALVRGELEADTDPNSVALLGASRMQSNVSLATLSEALGNVQVHQLAVSGAAPYSAYEDLALNSQFKGLVVLSIVPSIMMPGPAFEEQAPNVEYYNQHWNKARYIDTWLGNQVSSRMALGDRYYSAIRLLRNMLKLGQFAGPPDYVTTDINREMALRFENVDVPALRKSRIDSMAHMMGTQSHYDPAEWRKFIAEDFGRLVSSIEDRGGRVVVVYMPVSEDVLAMETDILPREIYWDSIAELTEADTIHFLDDPVMSGFDLPDASHLDYSDKVVFTQILAEHLLRQDGPGFTDGVQVQNVSFQGDN
ncbi:hypothetical protein [Ruegeria sp.]|uniref:hypothetical protein n=1 Tax=Ruegeria sp. TaxID=1879320 RepID=UPI003C7AB305